MMSAVFGSFIILHLVFAFLLGKYLFIVSGRVEGSISNIDKVSTQPSPYITYIYISMSDTLHLHTSNIIYFWTLCWVRRYSVMFPTLSFVVMMMFHTTPHCQHLP